jgi:hypothetical protein
LILALGLRRSFSNKAKMKDVRLELSAKELWTVAHGMIFGAIYLLAFGGALADLYELRMGWLTHSGEAQAARRVRYGLWTMSLISWGTVITGTWIVYPWYRAAPIPNMDLALFPRYLLLSKASTKEWHTFGMEWKEHISWLAPMLTTSVAACAQSYGANLSRSPKIRRALLGMLAIAFFAAAVAGVFGAFINKVAATR